MRFSLGMNMIAEVECDEVSSSKRVCYARRICSNLETRKQDQIKHNLGVHPLTRDTTCLHGVAFSLSSGDGQASLVSRAGVNRFFSPIYEKRCDGLTNLARLNRKLKHGAYVHSRRQSSTTPGWNTTYIGGIAE